MIQRPQWPKFGENLTTATIDYANYSSMLRYIAVIDMRPRETSSERMNRILEWVKDNCDEYEYVINDPVGTLTLLFHKEEDKIMCILKWV